MQWESKHQLVLKNKNVRNKTKYYFIKIIYIKLYFNSN